MIFYRRLIFFVAIFFIPFTLFAQSRFLEEGVAGTGFQINTQFDSSDSGIFLDSIGASIAYSIGGIMDIGFILNRENGNVNDSNSINWNLDLIYNLIAIKQNEVNPINIQLEIAYGYTNYNNSAYLDYFDYTKTSQGYNLGISIFHEFLKDMIISFIIGGEFRYSNFNHITYESSNPIAPVVESYEHEENLYYGGFGNIIFKPDSGPLFSIEVSTMFNYNDDLIEIVPSFIYILPSY